MKVGVLWSSPASGATFYINQIKLYKLDWEYQYYLTDHQGTPRVVLQTENTKTILTGTFESENANSENGIFLNVNTSFIETNHTANTTPGGNEVIRMNKNYAIGPARSLKVYPGDVVNAQVSAYYPAATGLSSANRATLASTLISVMAGGSQTIIDGINTAYNSTGNPAIVLAPNQGTTKPSAFLNYILFDENYKVLEAKSAALGNANTVHTISAPQVNVKEVGFLFVYLSYDNNNTNPVYFDDLKITLQESPVIQVDSYYPYGMVAYSWVREGEVENKYLYQGKELDDRTGWHDFHARQYDGAIGRWLSNDPKASVMTSYSNYNAMMNNPAYFVDPDGECPVCLPIIIGAILNTGIQLLNGNINNAGGFFSSIIVGGLSGLAGYYSPSGLVPGAVYGGGTGGIIGGIQSTLNGTDFNEGLKNGLRSGAIIGGLMGGFRAILSGGNILNGKITYADIEETESVLQDGEYANSDFSDEKLHEVAKEEFDFKLGKYRIKKLTAQSRPRGFQVNSNGDLITRDGETARGVTVYDPNYKTSSIYISKRTMEHIITLKSTLGHEFIHAYHHYLGLDVLFRNNHYKLLTENAAHSWQAEYLADYIMDPHVYSVFVEKIYFTLQPGGKYYLPYYLNHFKWYFKPPF